MLQNNLPSNDEDVILLLKTGNLEKAKLESGGRFWGTLNGFTEHRLFFTGGKRANPL